MLMHLLRFRLLSKVASETHVLILKSTYYFPESCVCAIQVKNKICFGFLCLFYLHNRCHEMERTDQQGAGL